MPLHTETEIMHAIMIAVSALPETLICRQQSGVFRSLDGRRTVVIGVPGIADIGGVHKGIPIMIEVKTARGRLRAAQRRFADAWTRAGGHYVVARSAAEALDQIRSITE